MDEIPYEKGSYYIFDRGYNDFGRLYLIRQLETNFLIVHFLVDSSDNLWFFVCE